MQVITSLFYILKIEDVYQYKIRSPLPIVHNYEQMVQKYDWQGMKSLMLSKSLILVCTCFYTLSVV